MRRLFPVSLMFLAASLLSCETRGCRDPDALNYDATADADGTCRYTRVIFYAASNRVGGTADRVTRIDVSQLIISDEQLLGTITDLSDVNPAPEGCFAPPNAVEYEFLSGLSETRFTTRYYYEDGSDEAGDTYILSPERLTECIVQNLTLQAGPAG